ncbi:MAG: hypothetical protein RI952_1489 [Bacteroidota bacterium]|jgi:hypothetical protein
MSLQALNLPPFPFQIKKKENGFYLFDALRKKDILITPEEWVRQHFIQFLINQKKYPKAFFAIEKGLTLHERIKRTDIVVYNAETKPLLIVECKAPSVAIDQAVFEQIIRYNYVHQAKYLVLSNGITHFCCVVDYETNQLNFISEIPEYQAI